jgi:hypothetical protein
MSTASPQGIAYSDLVGGLLDARTDPATERFDAQLAEALEAGTVTSEVARALRFWQRAAVRGVVDHARRVLPPALEALDAARQESADDVAANDESWSAVSSTVNRSVPQPSPEPGRGPAAEPGGGPAASTEAIDLTITGEQPAGPAPAVDLHDRRSRLIVAGLTEVPARTDTTS